MRPPEYAELDAYRLEKHWTWKQLAAAMRDADCPLSGRTLYHLLRRAHVDERPLDRTIYNIRKFLAHVRATDGAALERAGALMGVDAHA
jgi:hypothetical protein